MFENIVEIFKSLICAEMEKTLTKVKYALSILQIYWKYTSKVYLKYTSSIPETHFKYTSNTYTSRILQPVETQKYTSKVYLKYTSSIPEAHFKYTSNIYTSRILQPVEIQKKKKLTPSLYYFNKRSTFETHFVKIKQHFHVSLKDIYFKYIQVYLKCTF